ncbi:hypothetical protein XENOCAPTIV_005261, partial [Xenoophorus captivus]
LLTGSAQSQVAMGIPWTCGDEAPSSLSLCDSLPGSVAPPGRGREPNNGPRLLLRGTIVLGKEVQQGTCSTHQSPPSTQRHALLSRDTESRSADKTSVTVKTELIRRASFLKAPTQRSTGSMGIGLKRKSCNSGMKMVRKTSSKTPNSCRFITKIKISTPGEEDLSCRNCCVLVSHNLVNSQLKPWWRLLRLSSSAGSRNHVDVFRRWIAGGEVAAV